MTWASSVRPVSSSSWETPSSRTRSTKDVSGVAISARARHDAVCSLGEPEVGELGGEGVGRHLVELVDDLHDRRRFLHAEAQVEALEHLAVADLQRQLRHRQAAERLGHDLRDLDVEVEGQLVLGDDVDVGLGELAEPSLLGSLATPHALDLVAAERELETSGVLQHVARERHGEVIVQGQTRVTLVIPRVDALEDVDLLVDLALALQRLRRLDRAGLDVRETVQLEHSAQVVEDVQLDIALRRKELRESAQSAHSGSPQKCDRPRRGRPSSTSR